MTPRSSSVATLLTISAGLVVTGELVAQTAPGQIRGTITDRGNSQPVGGASVRILETRQTVETTAEGNFVFTGLEPKTYTLEVSANGYVREFEPGVVVRSGQLAERSITLAPAFTDLGEYVVEKEVDLGAGTEAALLQQKFDSIAQLDSIGEDLIGQAGAGDAGDAVKLIPGATVSNDGFATVRGLPDRFVSTQLNGVRLPSADEETRSVDLEQFPSTVIRTVQVSKTFTPDQQSDASGGAVNILLKSVPKEPFFVRLSGSLGYNSQSKRRGDFLSYEGGGVSTFGFDNRRRNVQSQPDPELGAFWSGALGVSPTQAPTDFNYSLVVGGGYDVGRDLRVGGQLSYFYARDTSFVNDGIDDEYWIEPGTTSLVPSRGNVNGPDEFVTSLFDVTRSRQEVQWGTLGTLGVESEHHSLSFALLYTRTASDTATVLEDTRGREFFFPGFDINDLNSPGSDADDFAPFVRRETLQYEEQVVSSGQLHGEHEFPIAEFGVFKAPKLDWTVSLNRAESNEPDRRQISNTILQPSIPGGPLRYAALPPGPTPLLGPVQRIFERVEEESEQFAVNFELPFEQWTGDEGSIRLGYFRDRVERSFNRDTFSSLGATFPVIDAPPGQSYADIYPFLGIPITDVGLGTSQAGAVDVDYRGQQDIDAFYVMADLPLTSSLTLSGGVRFEDSSISTEVDGEDFALVFLPGSAAGSFFSTVDPGAADASQSSSNVLPALSLRYDPFDDLTLRVAYSETVARQTFREIAPILQQEFVGGPIFVGTPDLEQADVENYDLRLDYRPFDGGLLSASYFFKSLKNPIETFQGNESGSVFTVVDNFPDGEIEGVELEIRQDLGVVWDSLGGLSLGANATFLRSEVTVGDAVIEDFGAVGGGAVLPAFTRDATGAPEFLYNIYGTYTVPVLETQIGLFYTVTGDTLVAGFGTNQGNLVPSIYQREFGTMNLTVIQPLGPYVQVSFKARNLTNPDINTVYRDQLIDGDFTQSSFSAGIDYSFGISAQFDL